MECSRVAAGSFKKNKNVVETQVGGFFERKKKRVCKVIGSKLGLRIKGFWEVFFFLLGLFLSTELAAGWELVEVMVDD